MNRLRLAAPLLGLGLVLAACSGTGASTAPTTAPSAAAPSEAPSAAASEEPASGSPAAAAGDINLAETALGSILADASGKTLYIFTADSGGKSACNDDCATNWPPLKADAAPAVGAGLDAAKFATITRDDGSSQVTFNGMPLYFYAADTAAGDTNGQGVGGKWYVVGADGTPIK